MSQRKLIYVEEKHISPSKEIVAIYHDEIKDNKNNPIAHGFLVVPLRSKKILLKDLDFIRGLHGVDYKLNFKKLSGAHWNKSYGCVRDWLGCLVDAMYEGRYIIRSNFREWSDCFSVPLGIKYFTIFMRSLSELSDEYWGWYPRKERYIKKFETLLRIGLKGGLHYLYPQDNCDLEIARFVTDARAFYREIDASRIITKLFYEKRSNIEFGRDLNIESVVSDHTDLLCKDREAAHLLQLCDLMLGAINFISFKYNHPIKNQVISSIKNLIDKRRRGRGFRNSKHYRTFVLNEAEIVDEKWKFKDLIPTTKERNAQGRKNFQRKLFY